MFLADLTHFLRAVFWRWQSWAGGSGVGGAVVVLIGLWERSFNRSITTPVYIAIIVGAFLVGAVFTAWRDQYRMVLELTARLANGPALKVPVNGCYVDTREFSWHEVSWRKQNASCIHLRIINDPKFPTEHGNANGIGATIAFLDSNNTELFNLDGRWGDSTQPSSVERGQSTFHLLTVDLPIGRTREIDIAFKYPEETDCFAFNNESYQFPRFQHPARRLVGTWFSARVRIRGPNVDHSWIVSFRNPGAGSGLEVVGCAAI